MDVGSVHGKHVHPKNNLKRYWTTSPKFINHSTLNSEHESRGSVKNQQTCNE